MPDFGADGTVVHSTDLNKILKIYAFFGSLSGGSPPTSGASSGWLAQFGSSVFATNGAGDANITFPTAFPGGCAWVCAWSAVPPQHVIVYGDPAGTSPPTTSQFSARAYSSPGGAVIASSNVRFNWFAIGF